MVDGSTSLRGAAEGSGTTAAQVTVVVVTFRGRDLLPACLDSLVAQTAPHRVLVVDNASTDGSAAILAARHEPLTVRRLPRNAGFAGGVTAALPHVDTPFLALLNDDASAEPGWLAALLDRAASQPEAAAWTSLLVRSDDPTVVNNAGVALLFNGYGADAAGGTAAADLDPNSFVFGFSGGAALLRTDAVRAVGGFPGEFFMYYEDLDTSWRLRAAGWQIVLVAEARVAHRHAATADPSSEAFHFHNERNRLWTLVRNAPAAAAGAAIGRFAVTTGSLVLRGLTDRGPRAANLRPALRLRVLLAVVGAFPRLLRQRIRLGRRAAVRRRALWRTRTD